MLYWAMPGYVIFIVSIFGDLFVLRIDLSRNLVMISLMLVCALTLSIFARFVRAKFLTINLHNRVV
jgi:hypothetical protein